MNPLSTKPTYLNYRSGANPPGANVASAGPRSTSSPSAPVLPSGIASNPGNSILVYVPGAASPSLSSHLSVLLSTHRIAAVHLIGGKDAVLKTLRTDVYTAAGRMRQDVAVSITVAEGAKEVEKAVGDVGARRQPVLGALVCEWDESVDEQANSDVLNMETEQVEAIWRSSVLPLHTLLRNLAPIFATTTPPQPQPFVYLDTAAQSPFAASSRAALLSTLAASPLAQNITIGQASEHLVPAASETQSMRSLQIDTNGHNSGNGNGAYTATTPEQSPLFGAESPTKLWASWAAQYE